VRQTETAAIKKAEGSRGTFDRKLNAVYTSATLEASVHQCVLSSSHVAMSAASVPCRLAAGALPLYPYPDICLRGLGLWRLYGISSDHPLTRACVACQAQAGHVLEVGQLGSERGVGEWTSAGLNAHLVAVVEAQVRARLIDPCAGPCCACLQHQALPLRSSDVRWNEHCSFP
jgi:hypothetical protein